MSHQDPQSGSAHPIAASDERSRFSSANPSEYVNPKSEIRNPKSAFPVQSEIRNPKSQIVFRPWLHAYAVLLVVATFLLLILGGTVTSKGAGLAVPDWPTTFNYHMFLFPTDMWKGNIFWEHLHRLVASGVGLMTIVMAIWLWHAEAPRDESSLGSHSGLPSSHRPWLRWVGVATLVLVIAQGVMGGLRVTQLSIAFAIFHGFTAQVFLCLTVLIAAATSKWWIERKAQGLPSLGFAPELPQVPAAPRFAPAALRRALLACYAFLIVGFIQLALGATVRHHGAGLAIPDFPLNYGNIVPPLNQAAIDDAMTRYAADPEDWASRPHENYTPFHVAIHLSHRLWAVVVLAMGAWLYVSLRRNLRGERKLTGPARSLASKLVTQVALGASVIWTGRHPEVATAHQTLGAAILATAAMILFRLHALAGGVQMGVSDIPGLGPLAPGSAGERVGVRGLENPEDSATSRSEVVVGSFRVLKSVVDADSPSPPPSPPRSRGRGGRTTELQSAGAVQGATA